MDEHPGLEQRCAMAILLAAFAASAVALLAWGPVLLDAQAHRYADMRPLGGVANGWNVWANLPLLAVGSFGLWVEWRSAAPAWLRRTRIVFHAAAVAGALFSAAYHVHPGDTLYLLAKASLAAAFVAITLALFAERVHPAFAGPVVLGLAVAVAASSALASAALGGDLRPLLLIQLIPLLAVPTGAIAMPGAHTRASDWLILLALYGASKLLDMADGWVLVSTGFVSGHTLMHIGLAFAAAWLVYCTTRSSAGSRTGAESTRLTSLNTSG